MWVSNCPTFFRLAQLADDSQRNQRWKNSKQLCRLLKHFVHFTAHVCFAVKSVYSEVRIYKINDESDSGITPITRFDQDKP
jgi:hypothetical protein